MRVLRISAGLDPIHGGPATSTAASCKAAVTAGIETIVAAVYERGADAAVADLEAAGIVVKTFALARQAPRLAWRWSVSPSLAAWVEAHARDFDLVHAHGAWTHVTVASLRTALRERKAAVLTPHESLTDFDLSKSRFPDAAVKRALRSWYRRRFDGIVFASELERESSHGSRRASYVVHHPLDMPPYEEKPPSRGERRRIGFLGRFDEKKNLPLLVEALPADAELHVAGDGSDEVRRAAIAKADEVGATDRVVWHGFIRADDKEDFFRMLDVLAMPSRFEGFGMVAAEALAAGVPVVVSRCTGVARIVEGYGCGIVIEPNVHELARALADEELDARRRQARRAAEAEFGLEAHGERLRRVYEDVLR